MLDARGLEIEFRGLIETVTSFPGGMTMHGGTIDPNISEIVVEIFR